MKTPRDWKRTNDARRDKRRAWYFKKKHGVSIQELDARIEAQGGKCPICAERLTTKNAHLDHDHMTGKLRDVLCLHCNLGIGHLRERPSLLRTAADYIEFHARRNASNQ